MPNSEVYGREAYDRQAAHLDGCAVRPELTTSGRSSRATGRLSGASLYELFLRLIELEGGEIDAYIDLVTPDDLTEVRQAIQSTVDGRTGSRGIEYPELATRMYETILLP